MKLVNRTPLPAQLIISEPDPASPRIGTLVVKATFLIHPDGTITLDTQDPYPVFDHAEETDLGLLPSDLTVRTDDRLEVILLGMAHSPGHRPVTQLSVIMTIGNIQREIRVYGDRTWQGMNLPPEKRRISRPLPFTQMPLSWERAFGGSAEILVDRNSPILVQDPRNPLGRGFDFSRAVEAYREILLPPAGYPQFPKEPPLPNLEDPAQLIRDWDDSPDPLCWATLPMGSSLHALRSVKIPEQPDSGDAPEILNAIAYQAHSDWIIEAPPAGTEVILEGMDPAGEIRFSLPGAGVWADYLVGERSGSRLLTPHMLVILTEEKRFYIVSRLRFNFPFEPHSQRSMRLRLDEAFHDHIME